MAIAGCSWSAMRSDAIRGHFWSLSQVVTRQRGPLLSILRERAGRLSSEGRLLWLCVHSVVLMVTFLLGCNKLTDQTLIYLRRIANVTLIDLRGCKQITRKACEHFISDLSINSLYCLSDEKLIQKIS